MSHHLAMFGDQCPKQVEIYKDLIYHMTSQKYVIEGSCNFMNGTCSWYNFTLPYLLAIGILVVETSF